MAHARGRLGAMGEAVALRHLEACGYQVLETNYRCRWGEVDIVTVHDDTIVFVEVRTRRNLSYGTPEESLSRKKIDRLIATAQTYMQACPDPQAHWRIDLISVRVGTKGEIEEMSHLENAVQLG